MIKRIGRVVVAGSLFVGMISPAILGKQNPVNQRSARENILTLMLLRMTQVLDLSEEQTAQLFPRFNRVEKEKLGLNREIGRLLRELRLQLRDDDPDPERLEHTIRRIHELRAQIKDMEAEVEKFVANNLTVIQRAKYLIFFQDFYESLRERLREVRAQQQREKRRQLPRERF